MPVIKWYLNLRRQYGNVEKQRAGQAIPLVAKRDFGHGRSAVGGRAVNWLLAEAGPHDDDNHYFAAPARLGRPQSAEHNSEFHNTLDITLLGGRTFTVTARKASGANNVTFNKQYQSWRRVYYTVHHMNDQCKTLFESVEPQIKAIFEAVFIELKPRGVRACILNQATSDSSGAGGITLSNTYEDDDPPLDRSRQQVRVVIARDVVHSDPFDAHWTMDSATNTPANNLIRISSEGINHREVVYTNDIAVINAHDPVQNPTVSVHDAEIAIPNACIARHAVHVFRIDLGADPSTVPIRTALLAGRKANLTATLTGHRCAAGYAVGNDHVVQATLTSANVESTPVTVGTARVWIAGLGASVFVEDPRLLLASPGAADQLAVTVSTGVINVPAASITRVSDHRLQLDLSAQAQVLADIVAGRQIQVSVRRHGLVGNGPIEVEPGHEFDLLEFTRNTTKTRRKVVIRVDGNGLIDVQADWLAPAANNPLTMRIETLGAPVVVPAAALAVPTPQKLKINLNADASLAAAMAAMAAGGKLTFDTKIKGIKSSGGYSPGQHRHFIALTARKLRADEPDATTARRMKLTFCHELGHALGLNFASVHNHHLGQAEPNDRFYNDPYGGRGPHCNHNARLERSGADRGRETTTSGEIYVAAGAAKLCIMYHAIDLANMGDDFCTTCKAHLRRAEVRL